MVAVGHHDRRAIHQLDARQAQVRVHRRLRAALPVREPDGSARPRRLAGERLGLLAVGAAVRRDQSERRGQQRRHRPAEPRWRPEPPEERADGRPVVQYGCVRAAGGVHRRKRTPEHDDRSIAAPARPVVLQERGTRCCPTFAGALGDLQRLEYGEFRAAEQPARQPAVRPDHEHW